MGTVFGEGPVHSYSHWNMSAAILEYVCCNLVKCVLSTTLTRKTSKKAGKEIT